MLFISIKWTTYQNLGEYCLVDFDKHNKNLNFLPRP